MSLIKQFWALLRVNLAGLPARLGLVCTIIIGVACAVGVLVSMLAMGVGARQEAMGNVSPNRATLTSIDAPSPAQSNITQDAATLIRGLPGIRRNADGKPIVVFQVTVFVQGRGKVDRTQTGFPLIGMTPGLTDYQPELHITAGRMFTPGVHELIASNKCARQYSDFDVGAKRHMRGGDWRVVGNFDLPSTVCLVFADGDTILSAFGRNTYNQANVMLESPATFATLANALKANSSLHLKVQHEAEIFAQDMQQLNGILNFISYFVGSIMALAATIGAANSLYAIVDGRRRELAILRAVGFNSSPIIVSVVLESILLALPGALIGALVAWVLFNGLLASPLGASFHMAVTPSLALLGLGWALCIGAIGGLFPALRAARVPVTAALRAT
ncbi:MAG TPA: ABC transporter permease [Steroidobacteraceae bacterium]|jgi:putative ABC transport system permease protein|nr:ABC transporter permease [Steroidobacteraceae bacterium]